MKEALIRRIQHLISLGLSDQAIAIRTGLSQPSIWRVRNGRVRIPPAETGEDDEPDIRWPDDSALIE
jgi:transcriptional regulator with XRE-family HTH domain